MNPPLGLLRTRLDALATAWPLAHAASPLNWTSELARLLDEHRRGGRPVPRFIYPEARPEPELPARLDELAEALSSLGPQAAQLGLFARELGLELRMILAVGSSDFAPLARQRFACAPADDERALAWAALPAAPDDAPAVRSDDEHDPRSLLQQLRARVAALALPVRVVVRPELVALAATGDGVVLVSPGQLLSPHAAVRTALHEVAGHVVPWWERRRGERPAGRQAGERDREEGLALQIEQEAGLLDEQRRKELAWRHVAARMAHEREPFARIVDRMEILDAASPTAVRLAARALRGGGLGRERVYLPALWRLADATA